MMWGYDGGWLWMSAMMLLVWGGVIALGVWAIRAFAGARSTTDRAMESLRQRLAAGDISPEEFDKTRKLLRG